MFIEMTRRAFCAAFPVAASPTLSILSTSALADAAPDDAAIITAVGYWLQMQSSLTDLWRRRDDAFPAAIAALGECPMGDHDANRRWHLAYNNTEAGLIEWAWQDLSENSDRYLTIAVNTKAQTPQGIAAKIKLYRSLLAHYDSDGDDYILDLIQKDINALSKRGRM